MRAEHHLRVVIDTNVWISAALAPTGTPAQLVRLVLRQGVAVFSPATFDELRSRLWKPKFDRWLSIEQRKALLHDISACAIAVDVPSELADRRFSRDRSDDAFIHAALAGQARWLVTGDQDLLTVTEPLPLALLTPAAALADPDFLAAAET